MKTVLKCSCLLTLLAVTASAQTLLYQWNLNNVTGSGTALTAAPSVIDASMAGGMLTNLNGGAGLSAPSGSGVNGANNPADLGLINSTAYRSTAGTFGGGVGNLSAINSFTVSLWFNFNATVTNFSSLNGGALLSRLINIATTNTSAADGDELYFSINTGTNLQFGVNKASTGTTTPTNQFVALGALPTPATMTNNWIFVAASYTTASGGTVSFYTGTATSNATPVSTLTGVGAIAWSATTNFIFIGNRGDGARSLPGAIDNVNFYSGVQTLAQIIAVQTNIFNSPTAGALTVSPSNTIFLGSSITITSAVTGLAPLFFQWRTDGGSGGALTNIPGATYPTLTNTPPNIGAFSYQLVVTNSYGSVTSAVAVVNVQSVLGTANVTVNVSSNLAIVSSMAYGLHTSVYDNQNGNSALTTQLMQSGVTALRYPGGGYADVFHWSVTRPGLGNANGYGYSPWQDGTYAYMGSQTDFGNFVKLLTNSQCQAVITVNFGSGQKWSAGHTNLIAPSTNAEPKEAAAWVAYANSQTNIYGTVNDVTLGTDSQGNDWKTAGWWAMLRAASPLGTDDGYNFLRINRKAPISIQYWEIGNETFGSGYYDSSGSDGYSVNYAVPYPYSTNARYGNTNLSPAAYGRGVKSFSLLMKQVDPTIKIGAVVTTPPADYSWDVFGGQHWTPQVLAQCATNFDFVIAHWYYYAGTLDDGDALLAAPAATIPTMINGSGTHTGANTGMRDYVNAVRADGTNVQIFITEFGYTGSLTNSLNGEPVFGPVNALFAADSYATFIEFGATNMDWLELNNNTFLGDSNPLVRGTEYYAVQLTHAMASPGDTLVNVTDDVGTLRTHAAVQQNGKIGVMLLNENLTNSLAVTVTIPNYSNLGTNAVMYQFGTNNFSGASQIPVSGPTTNNVLLSGNTFTVTVPPYTMAVVVVATNAVANTAPVFATISNRTVNVGQTVAFTASATDANTAQTLTFALLTGATNATLVQVNNTNANFSWRPLVTQANSTNNFSLKVSDNGSPVLSATQNFSVMVNPVILPTFAGVAMTNGQFRFSISGQTGPDYEIQTSTNLTQWSAAFITNSPTLPFVWTDAGASNSLVRFYRAVLGPPLP